MDSIEEVFSLASATGDASLSSRAALAIAATLDFAEANAKDDEQMVLVETGFAQPMHWRTLSNAEYGLSNGRKGHQFICPLYDYFLLAIADFPNTRPVDRRDTIITFNYDLLIEKALRNIGVPFEYGFRNSLPEFDSSSICSQNSESGEIAILKLHGSLNWAIRKCGGNKITVFGSYNDVRKGKLDPVLLPPTWQKVFRPQLSDVWDAAVQELRDATRIIILGYSMPPTDLHFKYLLAAGLEANNSLREIRIVNPNRDLQRRFPEVFRPEVESRLVRPLSLSTREFLTGNLQQIKRGPSGPFN